MRSTPTGVQAMAEVGLDLSKEFPEPLTTDVRPGRADVVITVGGGDICPIFAGKRHLDWERDDPAGRDIDGVRPSETTSTPASARLPAICPPCHQP